jgi:uroporphyrinogen-III decarboxylase
VFHFGGSEQATPPMMSPRLYEDFVVKYDSKLFDLVHRYGGYVQVHCHGNIRGILDRLMSMGVDLLDPVEAPPNGDITIREAKQHINGRITLVGNIQFDDMEASRPTEIDEKVKTAIRSGGKKHFILSTTEGPISPLSSKMRDNYIQLIESGYKYGKF